MHQHLVTNKKIFTNFNPSVKCSFFQPVLEVCSHEEVQSTGVIPHPSSALRKYQIILRATLLVTEPNIVSPPVMSVVPSVVRETSKS